MHPDPHHRPHHSIHQRARRIAIAALALVLAAPLAADLPPLCPVVHELGSFVIGAAPSLSADGSLLAFSTTADPTGGNPDGGSEVFLVETATGAIRQLTSSDQPSSTPSLDAAGRTVAYLSTDYEPFISRFAVEAFVHDLETGVTRRITRFEPDTPPRHDDFDAVGVELSADGRRLAVSVREVDFGNLRFWTHIYDVATGDYLRRVGEPIGAPALDPTGRLVAQGLGPYESRGVQVVDVDTGDVVRELPHAAPGPDFLGATGELLAFAASPPHVPEPHPGHLWEVLLHDLRSGDEIQATAPADHPEVLPFSSIIASTHGERFLLRAHDAAAGGVVPKLFDRPTRRWLTLVEPGSIAPHATLSADGTRLAYFVQDTTSPDTPPAPSLRLAECPLTTTPLGDGDRFRVGATWTTEAGESGVATPVPMTDDTAAFWFFSADNVELLVKTLRGCDVPGFDTHWVFAAGLTHVGVDLSVLDSVSGRERRYPNPLGTPFAPIQDTAAFPCDTAP